MTLCPDDVFDQCITADSGVPPGRLDEQSPNTHYPAGTSVQIVHQCMF